MEKLVLRSLKIILVLPLILTACSGSNGLEEVYGIDSNTQIVGSFSQYDNAKITASGPAARVRFTATVPQASSRAFNLKASLDQTINNSAVSVIFHSDDATVPNTRGIVVKFSRNGASVDVTISVNGTSRTVSSSKLAFYYPASLDLILDVHNVNNQARVLIWRRDVVGYTAANADVDTSRSGDLSSSLTGLSGAGGFVGLEILNATVSAASVTAQKSLD
ncbi:hypothetical protein AZI86_15475 [Bdellovibrio bacteriovorus]|uniref:Lipoprotein n=1 Tax=Bdellovibrio bacteriovorus TaxID=959 RepID=A0A150WHN1_BDEBC|nr:hypothetical protein [Bdellovibrio bacteriovorus]KYG63114.1 hypothetical protein AZI86_15475 [Bdellovibrio bacteriovorus]